MEKGSRRMFKPYKNIHFSRQVVMNHIRKYVECRSRMRKVLENQLSVNKTCIDFEVA